MTQGAAITEIEKIRVELRASIRNRVQRVILILSVDVRVLTRDVGFRIQIREVEVRVRIRDWIATSSGRVSW